jgi:hypothetical protein
MNVALLLQNCVFGAATAIHDEDVRNESITDAEDGRYARSVSVILLISSSRLPLPAVSNVEMKLRLLVKVYCFVPLFLATV